MADNSDTLSMGGIQEKPALKVTGTIQEGMVISDRYELGRHLGTGGFAKVYQALDRVIEREVAMKFLDLRSMHAPAAMIPVILERFSREAKLAARIPHRNVVNIFDIGQVQHPDGLVQPYIVMELLRGHDLEEQLEDHGPLPPRRLIPLFVDCLDALGEAHEMGIVHKDLKPSNLFLSDPGNRSEALRIVDFGIAHIKNGGQDLGEEDKSKQPGQGGRLTATGQILGTLQYLSPEYIANQLVTPALDVYQMGLILVEMLSGHRMVDTDNAFECLRIHTFGLLELPDYLLESELGHILQTALQSDHTQRYPDAKALADALSEVDPDIIPPSPLLEGTEVATSQFGTGVSSPGIAVVTSNVSAPTTGELQPSPSQRMRAKAAGAGPTAVDQDLDEASFARSPASR